MEGTDEMCSPAVGEVAEDGQTQGRPAGEPRKKSQQL